MSTAEKYESHRLYPSSGLGVVVGSLQVAVIAGPSCPTNIRESSNTSHRRPEASPPTKALGDHQASSPTPGLGRQVGGEASVPINVST